MNETMMALQIMAPRQAEWRIAPRPEPGPGEVLVRIEGITTCPHWDLHLMSGEPMFPGLPLLYPYPSGQPGHEAVGVIAALGPGVDGLAVGTRVAAWRDQGHSRAGCYAQYNLFQAENLLEVPADLPLAALAPLELAMCVQVSFDQLAQLNQVRNQRFGVSGLGPAGLIAVQMARAYGAQEVVAVDPIAQRRALAYELGAHVVMTPEELDTHVVTATGDFAALRGKKRFDAAIECTGLAASAALLLSCTRHAVATFGVLREPVAFGFAQWLSGVALLGYGNHNLQAAQRALGLVLDGQLKLAPLVTHQLPLSAYTEGVELLRRKEAIKVAFLPWA
jgi:threonine dehydrogenase-like Zn-dependent dehydrogenase